MSIMKKFRNKVAARSVVLAAVGALVLSGASGHTVAGATEASIINVGGAVSESASVVQGVENVTAIDGDTIQIETPDGPMIASFDKESGISSVQSPNGEVTEFDLSNIRGIVGGEQAVSPLFDMGGVPCSMILWTIDAIHAGGWAAAAVILSAQGAAGAAILAAVWGLGTSGFLALVGTQC